MVRLLKNIKPVSESNYIMLQIVSLQNSIKLTTLDRSNWPRNKVQPQHRKYRWQSDIC